MPKKDRISIADDDRLVLVTISQGLKKAGYETLEAMDGEEAIRRCKQESPDLAILDARMTGIDGIETARQIQATETPFIMLSAYDDSELINDTSILGALAYLVKPLDVGKLIPTIHTALHRAEEIKRLREHTNQLQNALKKNKTTSTAVGLLMERYHLTHTAAFELLRSHARTRREKIIEVADRILAASDEINIRPS